MKTKINLSIVACVALMIGIPVAFFMFNWNYLAPNEPVTLEQRVIVPEGHKVHGNSESWRWAVSGWTMNPTYEYEGTDWNEYYKLFSESRCVDGQVLISGTTTIYGSKIPSSSYGGWIKAFVRQDIRLSLIHI